MFLTVWSYKLFFSFLYFRCCFLSFCFVPGFKGHWIKVNESGKEGTKVRQLWIIDHATNALNGWSFSARWHVALYLCVHRASEAIHFFLQAVCVYFICIKNILYLYFSMLTQTWWHLEWKKQALIGMSDFCLYPCTLPVWVKAGIHYMTFKIWTDFKTPGIILTEFVIVAEEN